jgi:hypothetical protein
LLFAVLGNDRHHRGLNALHDLRQAGPCIGDAKRRERQ